MAGEPASTASRKVLRRLDAMRANPTGDWSVGDLSRVCNSFGITFAPPTRGSHYKMSHPSQAAIVTIPYGRPIKPVYIRNFVRFVDCVRNGGEYV